MAESKLGNLDALEEGLIAALIKQASEGSAAAAKQAQESIAKLRVQRAATAHECRLAELKGAQLVAYLGELGQRDQDVEVYLGRRLTEAERCALKTGALKRKLEVRAVGLERVRAGAKTERWMEI